MTKNQKVIGIDFDDVLQNFNKGLLEYWNARYNTAFTRDHVTEYYVDKLFGVTLEEMNSKLHEFCFSEEHELIEPLPGSKDVIQKLSETNKLVIITARPKVLQEVTETWLDLHFQNIFQEIHFTREEWNGPKQNKSELAKKLGINYFIEDSRENAHDIASVGIPVFLLNAPWNQGDIPSNVTRIHQWTEILDLI